MASKSFLDAVVARRSFYQLNKNISIPEKRVTEIINQTVKYTPSSFNSQSTRVVALYGKEHEKLWQVTKEILKPLTPEDKFGATSQKLDNFAGAFGTVLFFEDPDPVNDLIGKFPLYADHFGQWSEHTNAMHQYVLWTALETEGLGCSLQHYNPVIDQRVFTEWGVNPKWSLKSQLVFGNPTGQPGEKSFKPLEDRVFIHGASS